MRCANKDLLLQRCCLGPQPSTISVRTVFIPPRKKATKSKKVIQKRKEAAGKESPDPELTKESRDLERKIKEIQQFASSLKAQLRKDKEKKVEEQFQDIEKPVEQDSGDIDLVYNELLGDSNEDQLLLGESTETDTRVSLFDQPAKGIVLPAPILDRIGDSVVNIVSKENVDWDAIVLDLAKNKGGFKGVAIGDIFLFLEQLTVGKVSSASLELLHEMLTERGFYFNTRIYDFFMRQYAELGSLLMIESLYNQALQNGIEPTKYMYSYLIKTYSKHKNLSKINETLNVMHQNKLDPGLVIYTNILQLCVKLKDFKQAREVFQMMKFRSTQTKPDIEAYNTMIYLSTRENDFYKAMDYYRELLDEKLSPNLFTLNCLAICCSKNRDFSIQGWKFINEINERKLTPDVKTFEAMLRLAAKDGDLELARALYMTIFRMRRSGNRGSAGPEALVYLLMAYRDYKIGKVPSMLSFEEGATIRRNALNLVDFLGLHQDVDSDLNESREKNQSPPFLPAKHLIHPKQIIAESNAVWSFLLLNDPSNTMTLPNLATFLRIPIDHNEKEEFLNRFEQYTYPNPEIKKFQLEDADSFKKQELNFKIEEEVEEEDGKSALKIKEQLPTAIEISKKLRLKMERNSELYICLLSAGKRFGDIDICEKAWTERGIYRTTSSFQALSKSERIRSDYKFAKEMILAFLQLGFLGDAVKIVISTQNQFDWSFYTLKPLYAGLSKIGDERSMKIISGICNNRKGFVFSEMHKAQEGYNR